MKISILFMRIAEVTLINPLIVFQKKENRVYYFNGQMSIRALFTCLPARLVIEGNATQAEIVPPLLQDIPRQPTDDELARNPLLHRFGMAPDREIPAAFSDLDITLLTFMLNFLNI